MTQSAYDNFLDENSGMLRFFAIALIIYGSFYLSYSYVIIESKLFDQYLELSASLGAWLVNTLGIIQVSIEQQGPVWTKLRAEDNSYVIVAQGCDASTVFAVLIATLLAWPGRWRKKVPALIFGLLIMFALNIVRIAGMSLTESLTPDLFDLMHEWILPPLLVVGALLYFYFWTLISDVHPDDENT